MRLLILFSLLVGSSAFATELAPAPAAVAAAANPPVEVFKVKVMANIDRCTKHAGINALDCVHSPDAVVKTVSIPLDQCDQENYFGANCGGSWTKTLKRDNVTYKFLLLVGHYYKATGFAYQISLRIFQNGFKLDNAASNDIYLKDAVVPFSTNVVGARTAHIGYSGDETILYTPEFAIGDGVKLW